MKALKLTSHLILFLLSASAAQAGVGQNIGRALIGITSLPTAITEASLLTTACAADGGRLGHICRAADEAQVEDAINFLAGGQITPELREKLDALRVSLKDQNADAANLSDEELCHLIVDAKQVP